MINCRTLSPQIVRAPSVFVRHMAIMTKHLVLLNKLLTTEYYIMNRMQLSYTSLLYNHNNNNNNTEINKLN